MEGKLGVELLVEMGEKGHTGELAGEVFEVVEMPGEVVERTSELGGAVEMTVDYLRSQRPQTITWTGCSRSQSCKLPCRKCREGEPLA